MADIVLNDEDILLQFTEGTPVHVDFMNPIIENVNKNTTRSKKNASAIGQIANDRGYVNTKYLPAGSSFRDVPRINGKYIVYTDVDAPLAGVWWYFIDVIVHNELYMELCVRPFTHNTDKIFRRYLINNVWNPWIETATEGNTPIIKNIPAGITKIKDLPMGIYRIYAGSATFTDYPPLAKKMAHDYGILKVVSDNANYKTYSLITTNGIASHCSEYTGFSVVGGEITAIRWTGEVLYSVNAASGITILSQNSYILNGVMYMNLTVRKTDNSDFVTGIQYSIAGCPGLVLTYPKNVIFTGWDLTNNYYISAGGVGTVFTNGILLVIPSSKCNILRITGSFILE